MTQLACVLIASWAMGKALEKLGLPALVGFLLGGVLFGEHGQLFFGAAPWYESLRLGPMWLDHAHHWRSLALAVILLRAGMGLDLETLRQLGARVLALSTVPMVCEALVFAGMFMLFSGWQLLPSLLLACVVCAVSPAIIVPRMLALQERRGGGQVPTLVLAASALDDVWAITLFSLLLLAASSEGGTPLAFLMPMGLILGTLVGWALGRAFAFLGSKISEGHESSLVLVGVALLLKGLESWLPINALFAIVVMGLVFRHHAPSLAREKCKDGLAGIWAFAQVLLFVLIGAQVDPTLVLEMLPWGCLILAMGLVARSGGVALALKGSGLDAQGKVFATVSFWPKATVQAAIGGVVLELAPSLSITEGEGHTILVMATLAIVITAPLGAWAMDHLQRRWYP